MRYRCVYTEELSFCVIDLDEPDQALCGKKIAGGHTWFPELAEVPAEGNLCQDCRAALEEEAEYREALEDEYERGIENE